MHESSACRHYDYFDLKAHQCDIPHCANVHACSHPHPPFGHTHAVRDTQPNKYCLPVLCLHSKERVLYRQAAQLYLINSLFSLLLSFLSPHLPVPLAYIATPSSASDLAAESLQILSIYPYKHKSSDQSHLGLFLINYLKPNSWLKKWVRGVWGLIAFFSSKVHAVSPHMCTASHHQQHVNVLPGKGQRVTWNLSSQTRLSKVFVLCLSPSYE